MNIQKLLFSFIIAIWLVSSSEVRASNKPLAVSICLGQALKAEWEEKVDKQWFRVFAAHNIKLSIHRVPAVRAEFNFKHKKCDLIIGPVDYNPVVDRSDIFQFDSSVMRAQLSLFANTGVSPPQIEGIPSFINRLDHRDINIGYFGSIGLRQMMASFKDAHLIEVTDIGRGFKLFKHNRVDYLVIPEVIVNCPDKYAFLKQQYTRVSNLIQVELYVWADSHLLPHQPKISKALAELTTSEAWRSVFQH